MPAIKSKPISSHGGTRPRTNGLVLHIQVGNGSLGSYFGNPANNVSSAYWLGKDGTIEQYFDDALIGWTQADGNSSWYAVETEGYVDEPLTEAQLDGMAWLLWQGSEKYGFPIQNTDDVKGRGLGHHAMGGVAWGNHPCPGPIRIAQKDEIVRRALILAGQLAPAGNGALINDPAKPLQEMIDMAVIEPHKTAPIPVPYPKAAFYASCDNPLVPPVEYSPGVVAGGADLRVAVLMIDGRWVGLGGEFPVGADPFITQIPLATRGVDLPDGARMVSVVNNSNLPVGVVVVPR